MVVSSLLPPHIALLRHQVSISMLSRPNPPKNGVVNRACAYAAELLSVKLEVDSISAFLSEVRQKLHADKDLELYLFDSVSIPRFCSQLYFHSTMILWVLS